MRVICQRILFHSCFCFIYLYTCCCSYDWYLCSKVAKAVQQRERLTLYKDLKKKNMLTIKGHWLTHCIIIMIMVKVWKGLFRQTGLSNTTFTNQITHNISIRRPWNETQRLTNVFFKTGEKSVTCHELYLNQFSHEQKIGCMTPDQSNDCLLHSNMSTQSSP